MSWQRINIENTSAFKTLAPIQIFLNAIPESDFVKYVKLMVEGHDIGLQGITGIHFPRQLDEYEVYNNLGFDGVQFSFYEEEIEVNVPTFRKYLRMACDAYLREHPEDRQQIEEYLARPQPPLEEGALPEWRRRRDAGEYPKPLSEVE